MKIKDIFHAVGVLVRAIVSKIKNPLAPTKEELKAVSDEFAKNFDIKDDELEIQIEIAVALVAEGYSIVPVVVALVKRLLAKKSISAKG